jgi:hypothetical protein
MECDPLSLVLKIWMHEEGLGRGLGWSPMCMEPEGFYLSS